MSKIIINSKVSSKDEQEIIKDKISILKDNKICYNNDSVNVVISIKKDNIFIERKCDEYELMLLFKKDEEQISSYIIKTLNFKIEVKTITKMLNLEDNHLFIKYDLYMNDEYSNTFDYELEWRDL